MRLNVGAPLRAARPFLARSRNRVADRISSGTGGFRIPATASSYPFCEITIEKASSIELPAIGSSTRGHINFRLAADTLPLLPRSRSNETFWFSLSVASPARSTAEIWTKTSLDPSSGWIKPNPLALLKNFTVPLFISHSRCGIASHPIARRHQCSTGGTYYAAGSVSESQADRNRRTTIRRFVDRPGRARLFVWHDRIRRL